MTKSVGINFRRKDQLSRDVIWSVFEKVSQSNSRFKALDTLVVTVHSVRMPVGFGKHVITSTGRPLSVIAHLKTKIVEVKAEEHCLAHALLIAIVKVDKDTSYKAYIQGRKIRHVVETLLGTTGIELSNELVRFQEHFWGYKIVVYHGLSREDIMFEWQVDFVKRINLLYDVVERHYYVITNLTAAMARRYVCEACNIS